MNNTFSKYFAIFLIFGFCFTAYTNLRAEALLERKVSFLLGPYNMVTFYPDVDDKYSFYYLPLPPHLSLRDYGELKNVPVFEFLKYYNFDTSGEGLTQEGLTNGGVIQMAVTVSLPNELHEEAQKKLATAYGVEQSEKIKIGMIDIPAASMELYVAQGNVVKGKGSNFVPKFLDSGPSIRNAGDAPFLIEVTPEGSAVYEKMLEGTAGLGINYSYSYQGTTPYVDVEITGTWDKIYDFASTSSQFKDKVSSWFFWSPGANYESNWQSLKDDFIDNTDLRIQWNMMPPNTHEGEKLRALIEDNILTKILEQVFSIQPPKADEQAVKEAIAQDANGWFGGFNYAMDVTHRKTGKILFHYLGRERIVSKNNRSGNYISVKPKNEKMKAIMFKKLLPRICDSAQRLAIDNVSLPDKSELNSNIVTNRLKKIAENSRGMCQFALATKDIQAMVERIRAQAIMVDSANLLLSNTDEVTADFLLKPSIMAEGNGFTVGADIYNLKSQCIEFSVEAYGNNIDEALFNLWVKVRFESRSPYCSLSHGKIR